MYIYIYSNKHFFHFFSYILILYQNSEKEKWNWRPHANKKHKVNWNNRTFQIPAVEKDWKLRIIKESIFINSLNPQTEKYASKLINPEKGMEIAESWIEFNPMVRDMLKRPHPKTHQNLRKELKSR